MQTRRAETLYGSDAPAERKRRALRNGEIPIAVYGLGKMGLPLATVFAGVTENVVGVDVDEDVVRTINRGECHVTGEPGLPELVEEAVRRDALRATADAPTVAATAQIHVVIVPTTIRDDRVPDLSNLRTAVRDVGAGLSSGDLVVIESTVPPRTCTDLVGPVLESESGLSLGEFGLAFCPERTSSGRAIEDIRGAYPKVVGGADDESTRAAALLYDEVTTNEVFAVSDVTTAECVKVFEGIYRDVNIALANELARFTDELGVDVNEAIEMANTQPYCDIHTPGVGVGGHCIPYYPHFLIEEFATDAPLIRTARAVNDRMPGFAARKLVEALTERGTPIEDVTVLLLGVTYRAGVPETRKSPAKPLAEKLSALGATVLACDPLVDDLSEFDATPVAIQEIYNHDIDGVVLVTAHDEFEAVDWDAFASLVVVDGRQALSLEKSDHHVYTIGSG